jgi:hypothetical protein
MNQTAAQKSTGTKNAMPRARKTNAHSVNSVYVENGEVKVNLVSDTLSIEEARTLVHEVVDIEYSLP